MDIYIYIYTYLYIYIYRERERDTHICMYSCIYCLICCGSVRLCRIAPMDFGTSGTASPPAANVM